MPTYFQRPENALKRANEFIDVGKKQRALDVLYDVIKSKKHRAWQKIHEPIMAKYLQLCVELKKSHVAKEGLYQYKNICQSVNIKSLEDVVRRYLSLAAEKTEEARKESHQVVVDIDDLDVIQSPESLLLSAVSGEDTQDRTDRAILTPWVKFLWESYRQCLELLRNNSSVERLYQDIAQNAFKFCLEYQRKTEFRKLCDNLRMHLNHVHKYQHQQRAINLNNVESQAMHLETRLVQLDSAITMELWQEAFKAVEDIHGLITMSKKHPKPSLMANYYQKLGLVFWKSGNHMFHACAWHRLFHLSKEQRKNLSQEELTKLASRVLCATLAIPLAPVKNEIFSGDDGIAEKKRRLATLLGMPNTPTRATLVKDLVKFNIMQHVHPELRSLYKELELEFQPLKLASTVESSFKFIENNEDLAQYLPALHDMTVTKILQQVAQLYENIKMERFCQLIPFADNYCIEKIIVAAAKNLGIQVRLCHRSQMLSFGTDLCASSPSVEGQSNANLQSMPSEYLRNQLTHMACALEKAVHILQPNQRQKDELRHHIAHEYKKNAKRDHQKILERWKIIEEHKEELENINYAKEQEMRREIEEQHQKQIRAEQERLDREAEERDKQRMEREQKEITRQANQERLEQLKGTKLGAKVLSLLKEEEIAELDSDEILQRQVEQLEKEKKELGEKLRSQEKRVDYLERAKRLKEIGLLEAKAEEDAKNFRDAWNEYEANRVEQLKSERENALKQRDRLKRMREEKDAFLATLKEKRYSIYKEKLAEFEERYAEEKQKRLLERKEKRKEERRAKYIEEKEAAEQKRKDEEEKAKRVEEEERKRLEKEKELEEYKKYLEKQNEIANKQRQKEIEIEERQRAAKEQAAANTREPEKSSWRPEGDSSGKSDGGSTQAWRPSRSTENDSESGWRAREKAREDSWRPKAGDSDRKEEKDGKDDWRAQSRVGMPRDVRLDEPAGDRWRDKRSEDDRGGDSWRSGGGGGSSWRDRPRRDDDRSSGYGGRRDDDRGGYSGRRSDDRGYGRRDDDRGGFGRRDDDRGGFGRRDDDRGGFGRRDDDRGGFGRRDDDRGGFGRRDDDRGGFGRRDDDRGGFGRRDDDRGGFGRRDDDRGGYGRRDDRGGYGRREDGGGSWRRGDDSSKKDDGDWRRGGGGKDSTTKDEKRAPARGDSDRTSREPDDDGWRTVRH